MLIAVGSQSAVKREAVREALDALGATDVHFVCVPAHSLVNEQPFEEETALGASNRLRHTIALVPHANLHLAIESGLFEERPGCYLDRAIVVVRLPNGQVFSQSSEGVLMPTDAVEEVRRHGAAVWTIGKILQEAGRVSSHDDPHLSLTGRSRSAFIKDVVVQLLAPLLKRQRENES